MIANWARQRIDELLRAPRMWGSREAVEMQVITLLEVQAQDARHPVPVTQVRDDYVAFLRRRFPDHPSAPLCDLLRGRPETEFVAVLRAFVESCAETGL